MPSVLFVLTVAIFFALGTRHILGARGSMIAALCWLTNLGMLEMGRSIEIEAVYISLFTVALIFWLVSWQQDRSPWLTWTVPWFFLGLGLLAKGPAHLFFFYALIFGVLRRTGRLREFIKLPHLVGIIVLLGVFGAWLVPYLLELRAHYPLQTWWYELSNIVRGDEISSQNWWLGFPRRIAYFLPWILLLPFIRLGKIADAHQREICRGLIWGSVVAFLVMLPWPGVRPRYILPLLAPFCWVIGVAVAARPIICLTEVSRSGLDMRPRKYFCATMLVAVCDQNLGNSTLRCSNAGPFLPGMNASRISHSISSNGSRPGDREQAADGEAGALVDDAVDELVGVDLDGGLLLCGRHFSASRWAKSVLQTDAGR